MSDVFLYVPHPDDETLSMGLAATYYLSLGMDVHFVFMSRGPVTPASVKLDGSGVCGFHGYIHNPAQEQYTVPSTDDIGTVRFNEGKAAAGQMGVIDGAGKVLIHEGNLPPQYGGVDWQNPLMVADAQQVMRGYVDASGVNTFHHTMSWTDRHPDHACLGQALRNLKQSADLGPKLQGSRFFVSRLYWDQTKYPDVAALSPSWVSKAIKNGRTAEYVTHLRSKVAPVYSAWCPPGAYGIGAHQVINQFYNCGLMPATSTVNVDNQWHA